MKAAPKQKCPQCENPDQVFTPQQRRVDQREDGTEIIEVYIRCTTCFWEAALRRSTPRMEKLMKMRIKLQADQAKYVDNHGGCTNPSMERILNQVQHEIRQQEELVAI